ncbi:MAG TPA: ABC transporter substrate-binding protein, partial [Negativicutes bacterium]|nr:ABC transporter substrate-binding protein [Negativicutes bacterium]
VYNNIQGVEDIRKGVAAVGQAVGEIEAAEQLMIKMDKTLQEVQAQVRGIPETKRQTVVWVSAMGMRGGKGSLFDSMCQHAGVINGAAAIGLGKNDVLSKENIIRINPDILLMPTWSYQGKVDIGKFRAEVEDDPALQTLKAIRNRRLVAVSDQYLYCSSQHIVDGVKAIARAAYPEAFRKDK